MKQEWQDRVQQSKDLLESMNQLRSKIECIELVVVDRTTLRVNRNLSEAELKVLTEQVEALGLSGKEFTRLNALLQSLDFDKRPVRHESIPEAHQKTFRWIFDGSSPVKDSPGGRFVDWLESDHNLFWISGKPGSGKSTLMKYIADSKEIKHYLRRWTGSRRLVLASHYFWSSGTSIQRSREGLLRSLLFDIFTQIPEIINIVYEDLWKGLDLARLSYFHWNLSALEAVMSKLAQIDRLPARICFLVDGLDEFEGDQLELSRAFRDLSACRDIKICLSSRPWNIFEDSFGLDLRNKLYIHELTRDDILHYSENRLYDHPRWLTGLVDQSLLSRLVNEITDRAQGVFLWVFLVTEMLREGLANHDSLSDLTKRLESLPVDLETFFKHILSSVEPFYHQKMASTLLIALTAKEPLPLLIYSFHELEYADADFALKLPIAPMAEREVQELRNSTIRRLNGWCKGLVEIRHDCVEFIHRTVRDFLQTEDMTSFLRQKVSDKFNGSLSILRSYWAKIKSDPPTTSFQQSHSMYQDLDFGKTWRDALEWAGSVQHEDSYFRVQCEYLLDDMEEASFLLFQSGQLSTSLAISHSPMFIRTLFREQVIRYALVDYISRKLEKNVNYFANLLSAPLSIAGHGFTENLKQEIRSGVDMSYKQQRFGLMLKSLLENGNNPNEMLRDDDGILRSTPWADFNSSFWACRCNQENDLKWLTNYSNPEKETMFVQTLKDGLFAAFLDHRADVNADVPCIACHTPRSRPLWTIWVFFGFTIPTLYRHAEHYLRDLRRILTASVHFDQENTPLRYNHEPSLRPEYWTFLDPGVDHLIEEDVDLCTRRPSPWSLLRQLLIMISQNEVRVAIEKQHGFLGQIILMLIDAAPEHAFWNDILPPLKELLPPDLFSQVLQALGRPIEVIRPNMRRRVRRLSQGPSEDTVSPKKARVI